MMENNPTSDRLARILDEVEREGVSAPSPEPAVSRSTEERAPASPLSSGGLGALLGGLAADPSVLSAVLPALLSAMSGAGGGQPSQGEGAPPVPTATVSAAPLPKPPPDRHTALLCAIKPYLGERRQATAETVLRLCRVWDALSRAGVTPSLLAGLLGGGTSPVVSVGGVPVEAEGTSGSPPSDSP